MGESVTVEMPAPYQTVDGAPLETSGITLLIDEQRCLEAVGRSVTWAAGPELLPLENYLRYEATQLGTTPEDLRQTVVERLLRKAASTPDDVLKIDYPVTYFQVSMRRLLTDRARRRARTVAWQEGQAVASDASVAGPESTVVLAGLVRSIIDQLPSAQRSILFMRHFEDLSQAEICQLLGMKPNTMRSHELKGRRRLKEILGILGIHSTDQAMAG